MKEPEEQPLVPDRSTEDVVGGGAVENLANPAVELFEVVTVPELAPLLVVERDAGALEQQQRRITLALRPCLRCELRRAPSDAACDRG